MFYIYLNKDQKITSVSSILFTHKTDPLKSPQEYDDYPEPICVDEDIVEFTEQYPHFTSGAYYYRDGQIICNEEELVTILHEKQAAKIRKQRETECFPIINRGQMWYMMRTPEQIQELQIWYQAWLDAPETLTIPDKPTWLE